MRAILAAGADKVTINTAAVRGPGARAALRRALRRAVHRRGHRRQARRRAAGRRGGRRAGRSTSTAAARRPASTPSSGRARAAELGAGEILLTSMDRDGTQDGYDLELTRAVRAVDVPVIASGGVGTLEHLADGLVDGRGRRRAGGRRSSTSAPTRIAEAKEYLAARGVPVRPVAPARAGPAAGSPWTGADRIELAAGRRGDAARARGAAAPRARLVCLPTDTVYGVGGL